MPTLPLYVPPRGSPNAWHRVTAPGGYEVWRFEAEDAKTGIRLAADFFEGCIYDRAYMHRYARYRRHPTRNAPPAPSDYPCVNLTIFEAGKVVCFVKCAPGPAAFSASDERFDIRIGPNFARIEEDGSFHLHVENSGGSKRGGAHLWFHPTITHPPLELMHLSRQLTGTAYRWIIAGAHCRVSGSLQISAGSMPRDIPFNGLGTHDHEYATSLLDAGVRRWIRGRAMFEDRATLFSHAVPDDPNVPAEDHVIDIGPGGLVERTGAVVTDVSPWKRLHPEELRIGDDIVLASPTVPASPLDHWVIYDAIAPGRRGVAICRVVQRYP